MQLQDGRKLCNHLVMFSSLLLVIALNQWWIELAFTRINIKWQGTFLSLFIYFFFCKMFLIPCNRKKRQCLYRTKVTYTICRITYNYQYAPRSLRLIFCLRLWVSALNFLKKLLNNVNMIKKKTFLFIDLEKNWVFSLLFTFFLPVIESKYK